MKSWILNLDLESERRPLSAAKETNPPICVRAVHVVVNRYDMKNWVQQWCARSAHSIAVLNADAREAQEKHRYALWHIHVV